MSDKMSFGVYNGICETDDCSVVTAEKAAQLGKYIGMTYKNICIAGCFQNEAVLYAVAGGAAEYAENIYFCENSDILSFRFSIKILEADIGIYVDKSKIILHNRVGKPLNGCINEKEALSHSKKSKVYQMSSFKGIYISKLRKENNLKEKISCGISCGKRSTKEMWLEFFTGEDDKLVLQISDDGTKANLYSAVYGAITCEQLITAYIIMKVPESCAVYLPESFHYQAESAIRHEVIRYSTNDDIPSDAVRQPFFNDMLKVCTAILSEKERLFDIIRKMPQMVSAKRMIRSKNYDLSDESMNFRLNNGKIVISRISSSLLSVCAQSDKIETASEICGEWCGKLLRNNGIPDNKH